MKNFKDKVVVITGAGAGMGRGMAISFGKMGAKLALNDFNESALEETKSLLSSSTQVISKIFDVSVEADMNAFADEVVAKFNRVDVVINNAGVSIARHRMDEISKADYEWIMGINFWGVFHGTMAFLPHLRKQKESSVVNFSSIFGLHGIPGQGPYSMTKFAVRGFTESLELEEDIHKTGVSVSCVHPGGIKTGIARAAKGAGDDKETIANFEKSFITTPEKAVRVIINGIKKKKSRILIGPDAYALHFITRFARFIAKFTLKSAYKSI